MFKKLIFIGLGISIIVVKRSLSYLTEKKDKASEQLDNLMATEAAASQFEATEQSTVREGTGDIVSRAKESAAEPAADDLTKINGIGPTYAKRLMETGITTFGALSNSSPEELRIITKATGKAADTESWIIQASKLN